MDRPAWQSVPMATEGNWLTDRLDLRVPLVCAPMAGAASGSLAAAVSAAGGLGMIGAGHTATPTWITEQCELAGAGGAAYGVGLMAWVLARNTAQLDAVIAARPALVSVSFGNYAAYVEPLRAAGIVVATQVGNRDEALAAEEAGVDVIVARGGEGGGHGRNEMGTLPLLETVLGNVDVPVLAAGGISSARGLAAVLAAGAIGAWVGTAFLACTEADTAPAARTRLFGATETGYGRVFDVAQRLAWPPEYGGRALRNDFFDRWVGREDELDDAAVEELAEARRKQDFDVAYIYAGQGVTELVEERRAADVVADFAGARNLLRRAAGSDA